MTTEWSLDELYKGFDDPAYGKDVAELTAQIDALATLLADAGRMQEKERTEKVLAAQERDRTAFLSVIALCGIETVRQYRGRHSDGRKCEADEASGKNSTVRGRGRKAFSGNPGRGCAGKRERACA
ncbi:MAG: hypothetical protein ACLR7N_06810 [Roseburia hominis]